MQNIYKFLKRSKAEKNPLKKYWSLSKVDRP